MCGRWWCWLCGGLESFHNGFALVVHAQSGDNQPSNPKNSHERVAGCFCVGVPRLSWGCGTGLSRRLLSLCCCLFLSLPCQAVAFGQSFARSHAAGVLFRCGLCFRWIGGHMDRGSGRCVGVSSGIVSSVCVAIVYIGGSKSSKFLRDSFKVPARFLPSFSQVAATWWWCLLEQDRLANYIKALEWVAFAVSAGVCGLWWWWVV